MKRVVLLTSLLVSLVLLGLAVAGPTGTLWFPKDVVYGTRLAFESTRNQILVYAPSREVYFSLWRTDGSRVRQAGPDVGTGGDAQTDTVYTVPRGTSLTVKTRFDAIYYKTGTTANDSTAIYMEWE